MVLEGRSLLSPTGTSPPTAGVPPQAPTAAAASAVEPPCGLIAELLPSTAASGLAEPSG